MAKQRFVNTEFWIDDFIESLDPIERYLFLYFLTNMYTSICGIYKLPMRQITGDTKLTEEQIKEILKKFWVPEEIKKQKIAYIDGWVFVKNFERHQAARGSEKVKKGILASKKLVPVEILYKIKKLSRTKRKTDRVSYPIHIDAPLDSDSDSDLDSDLDQNHTPLPPKGECDAAFAEKAEPEKPRRPRILRASDDSPDFRTFWEAYPRHVARKAALTRWLAINPSSELTQKIISAVEIQKQSPQWQRDRGKYIPHPATWLNQERWEDEMVPQKNDMLVIQPLEELSSEPIWQK